MLRNQLNYARSACVTGLTAIVALALLASPAAAQSPLDQIDLSQASIYSSPPDIASWPVTTQITRVTMSSPAGLSFEFSKKDGAGRWPDYLPPGWSGPLEYTVWAMAKINGRWAAAGFIQMWNGRPSTGAPILTDFARNWAYSTRWGTLYNHQPVVGEVMGFFVSAGNARDQGGVTSVRERSNVVAISLPANDTGVFDFPLRGVTRTIIPGDFNVDAKPDLIAQDSGGVVTLSMNSGTQWDAVQSPYNGVTSSWNIVGVGDFNRDGKPDLVWQSPAGAVVVWLNNGTATPPAPYLYSGTSDWKVVGVADINRDGSSDLIWQAPTGQVVVWLMNGTTFASGVTLWGGISSWRVVGAGDFNGDGNADLVWQGPGGIVVWYMNGTTQMSGSVIYGTTSVWQIVSVGDVNGDGKPDLVWRGPTGQMVTWLMNGAAASQVKYLKALPTTGWILSDTP